MSSDTPPREGRLRRGVMLILCSPSGAGKTSLARRLTADFPDLALSVSCTTRGPRPGEQEGREYYFTTPEGFDRLIEEDAFFEWAHVHDHRYGTPHAPVMKALSSRARKATQAAISLAAPRRPTGICPTMLASTFSGMPLIMSVSM